jgi:hypothetical protein
VSVLRLTCILEARGSSLNQGENCFEAVMGLLSYSRRICLNSSRLCLTPFQVSFNNHCHIPLNVE